MALQPAFAIEILRFVLVAGVLGFLAHKGRQHDLHEQAGWSWILAGLSVFLFWAGVDLVDGFWSPDAALPAALDYEDVVEDLLLPLAGLGSLAYGLAQWVPLPGRVAAARDDLRRTNEELEAKVAERTRELREQKAFNEQLLETSPAGITVVEGDGTVAYANPRAEEILGLEDAEKAGRTYKDPAWGIEVPDGGEFPTDQLPFARLKAGEDTVEDVEHAIRWPSGKRRVLSINGTAVRENGELERAVFAIRDITEEHERRKALEESEERFRSLQEDVLDDSSVGLFLLDEDMRIVWINEAIEEYFGIDRDEVIGRDKREVIEEQIEQIFEDPGTFRETVFATYDDNTYTEQFVCHVLPGAGRGERWLQHTSRPIDSGFYRGGRLEQYNDITARVEAQRQVAESEQRLREVTENLDAAVWLATLEEDVAEAELLYANPAFEAIFEMPSEVLHENPMAFLDRVHPDDVERVQREIEAIDPAEPGFELEYRLEMDDGRVKHVHTRGYPVLEDGRPVRLTGITEDVTERVRDLRALEIRNRAMQTAPVGIILTDPRQDDNPIVYANDRFQELTGYEEDEILGRNCRFLQGEDTAQAPVDEMRRAIEAAEPVTVELRNYRKDGTEFWNRVTIAPVRAAGEEITHFVGFQQDVTHEVEAERAVEQSKQRVDAILQATPAIVFAVDAEGTFTFARGSRLEAVDLEPDEVVGDSVREFFRGHPAILEAVEQALEGEPVEGRFSFGGIEWDARFEPQFGGRGEVTGVVVATLDVTEQVQAQQRLRMVIDRLHVVLFSIDTEGRFTLSEGRGLEALDLEPGEAVGQTVEDLYGEEVEAFVEQALAGESARQVVDVGDASFDVQLVPRFQDGGVVAADGVGIDVTELRDKERELEETVRRLDRAQEVARVGDWTWDVGADEVSWSPTLHELWGIPEDEDPVAYERMLAIMHPEDRDELEQAIERAAQEGEAYELEHRIVRPGGTVRWMQTRGEVETGPDGEVRRLAGTSQDVTELVEARRQAEHERHRYEQLLKAVPRCIVQIDRDGRFVFANERARDVLGLEPSEVTGRAYNDPDWRIRDLDGEPIPDDQLPFRKVVDSGEVVTDERHTIRWPDGTERVLSVHGAPIFDEDGEVESTVFALGDITEQLEQQRAIERERDLRDALFEENVDPIVEVEFEGEIPRIQAANPAFEAAFGVVEQEIVGRTLEDAIVPDQETEAHREYIRRVRQGEDVEAEVTRRTPEGLRPFRLHVFPLEDSDTAYAWYTDLHELRQLEREEALKARMLDQVGEAVIATDPDGTVRYWNQHAEQMYGYDSDDVLGRNVFDLTVPGDPEDFEHAQAIMDALNRGEAWSGEFTVQRKDRTTFPALVSNAPVVDEEGELEAIIGVSTDISDLKKTQRELAHQRNQLRARNRELRELAQATAHEFRTPITDVARYVALLDREAGDRLDEDEAEYLDTALDGAHRLRDLVDTLQEYLNASARPTGTGPCNAGEVLDDVLVALTDAITEGTAEITVHEPTPDLAVDERSLGEVFYHLIENAVRFRDEEDVHIEVGFEREDDMWVVSVKDDGPGISTQYHERIFRPFEILHGIEEGGGPGLGLALARGIVEAHGGTMWVDSEEGEGATFYMTLPAVGAMVREFEAEEDELTATGSVFEDDSDLFED